VAKTIDLRSPTCTPNSSSSSPKPAPPTSAATQGARGFRERPAGGDTCSVPARLSANHFVGRRQELAELSAACRDAADERPRLVLLGGESGVGKTRLLTEFEAGLDDAQLLRGECLEQGDAELPYAPLLGALRPLVRSDSAALAGLSPGSRASLAALLPSLGEPALDDRGAATGQARLFEALLELLDRISQEAPVVLILEDMHWADRSTRAFVSYLARSLRGERLLVILTYRSDELHRRHPVRPLLAELDRLECARRLTLEPFTPAELTEALADILGRAPEPELVERMLARSEGNPLYIEELLAAGLDGRGAAPQSLRDAFLLRVERLSAEARRVTEAVAVGVRLDEPAITAVAGVAGERRGEALREAVAEQVLVAGEDGRFRLRHALLREALYEDLLPGERVELHLALARALDAAGAERDPDEEVERVAAVARHYDAGGDQAAALRAMLAAAGAAERVNAWSEVAETAERALELWHRVAEGERPDGVDHVALLGLASRGQSLADNRTRAEQLLESALAELDPEHDPVRYGELLARMARLQWSLNRPAEALASAERAQALLPVDSGSIERAGVVAWLARTRVLRGRYRDAIGAGEAALAAAVEAGAPRIEAEVLDTLGMAHIALGRVAQGERELRRAIELSREHADLDGIATGYSNLADLLNLAGRTGEALEVAREGLAETPSRVSRNHAWLALTVSALAFEAGEWELAREHLDPSQAESTGTLLIFRHLTETELSLGAGDHDGAARCLDAVEPLVRASGEAQWHGQFGSLSAELHRRQGDLDGARAAVARALDELEVCTDDVMRIARVTAIGLSVEADRALRARDLREPADERDALARARIHLQRLRAAASAGGPVERAWREVGAAELARARGRRDPARWARAAQAWRELGRPYLEASALWRQAEALTEADERAEAAEPAAAALALCRRLGAQWLAGEVEALIARGRLQASAPSSAARVDRAPEADDPFGLTPRERQVLALIAEGATNRQIGAALYMAEKTASVHVSRILAKLGVQSRTQAAAVAHRRHLA